jgi:hypothetical protein
VANQAERDRGAPAGASPGGPLSGRVAILTGAAGGLGSAMERHGRLDILVLNAGAQAMNPIASYAEADWDRLMNLMVKGPFLAMKFAWPQLTGHEEKGPACEGSSGCARARRVDVRRPRRRFRPARCWIERQRFPLADRHLLPPAAQRRRLPWVAAGMARLCGLSHGAVARPSRPAPRSRGSPAARRWQAGAAVGPDSPVR